MKNVIKKNYDYEYIINKSKFIVCLRLIYNKEEINDLISDIKNKYRDATHYCYAYIIDNIEKCSDDKEPSGTAGVPILNALKRNHLTNVLCVVVRYFGGIKLGTGGLLRAYSNSVNETIKKIGTKEKIEYLDLKIIFDYTKLKDVEYILSKCEILKKDFEDKITFEFKINKNEYDDILKKLNNLNIIIKNM